MYGYKLSGLRVLGIAEVFGKENTLCMTAMVDHNHNCHKRKILFYSFIIILLPSRFYENVFGNGWMNTWKHCQTCAFLLKWLIASIARLNFFSKDMVYHHKVENVTMLYHDFNKLLSQKHVWQWLGCTENMFNHVSMVKRLNVIMRNILVVIGTCLIMFCLNLITWLTVISY